MITSLQNPQIRSIIALLKLAKERKKQERFVAEGPRMCLETPPDRLEKLYVSESFLARGGIPESLTGRMEVVKDSVFDAMSDTCSPQGLLALVKMQESRPEDLLVPADGSAPLLLFLENLQDPGNLGTILRTAEGAGVTGVILSKGCVDIYSPKVIRSTMGALYRVPFARAEDFSGILPAAREKGIRIYAAILKESVVYTAPDYNQPTAFLIGNEGNGLTEETIALADTAVRIPMKGHLESLNAAVAAALLVYEAGRQRGFQG